MVLGEALASRMNFRQRRVEISAALGTNPREVEEIHHEASGNEPGPVGLGPAGNG